jgi:hypothetical protein
MQLAKQAQKLRQNDMIVFTVQTSKVDENILSQWAKKNDIPFPVEMVRGDEQQIRSTWGVKALPWLILTDRQHKVVDSGFAFNGLDDKINALD